ncbi:hypothetical protein SAMN04487974_102140 [Pelagibacterium luteolum]|uniref:Uncharacterized protein n=1 Tax=Pelagibacterium luteolum TaxID=440168 RepID=A0A1G7TIQ7_9HYPH|nr:hypothetical protein SAMN04487974_102140 [Pelagibacterium luteolum]
MNLAETIGCFKDLIDREHQASKGAGKGAKDAQMNLDALRRSQSIHKWLIDRPHLWAEYVKHQQESRGCQSN